MNTVANTDSCQALKLYVKKIKSSGHILKLIIEIKNVMDYFFNKFYF